MSAGLQEKDSGPRTQAQILVPSRRGWPTVGRRCRMMENRSNTSYALLALALAASLLYRPVIAADPEASRTPGAAPEAQSVSAPLRQDFDALISEIEAREPAQAAPAGTAAG